MRILERGTILDARSAPLEERSRAFPSPARLGDGRLIVSFRTGSAKDSADEDSRAMASDDQGRAWQVCTAGPSDLSPGGRARCVGIPVASRGRRGLHWVRIALGDASAES
jgi:hypothetical protein